MPYYTRDPKRDHNFDNHPYEAELGLRTSQPTGEPQKTSNTKGRHAKIAKHDEESSDRQWRVDAHLRSSDLYSLVVDLSFVRS